MKSILLFLILLANLSFSQNTDQLRHDSTAMTLQLDTLTKQFGFGKILDEEYQLSFLTALSHYPELDSTTITLKKAKINTSLNARPTIGSLLFRSKDKRKYIIRINTRSKDSLILLKDVPYTARVGVFGHELGHIYDYSTRSFWGILKRLFAYSGKRSKTSFEKEIDTLTISRNLGLHLYDWAYYVLEESNGTEEYKAFKRAVYLEPEEILERINQSE